MEWDFFRAVGFYVRGMLYGVVSFLAHQYCVSSQGSWHFVYLDLATDHFLAAEWPSLLFLYVFLSLFVGCRLFVFGYYSSFLFWVTATSFVALSGFGLNFLFHSGLTKTHLVHQKWNRKEKTKPQFCLHFILKHKFWDCVGYDSMKISTLLSLEDPDNHSFSTKILILMPILISALLFIKSRGFHVSDLWWRLCLWRSNH